MITTTNSAIPNSALAGQKIVTPVSRNTPRHPRGLVGQMRAVLLQPELFFRTLPTSTSQYWLLVAFVILALVSLSRIQQLGLASTSGSATFSAQTNTGSADGSIGSSTDSGTGSSTLSDGSDSSNIAATWQPALSASSELIINWLALSILLCVIPLSKGRWPRFGQSLKISVFASLPLALMSALQLLYYRSGGQPGKPGLSGFVSTISTWHSLSPFVQALLLSLSAYVTIFWLWNLILLYIAARNALGGRRLLGVLIVVLWMAWLVIIPLVTNPSYAHLATQRPGQTIQPAALSDSQQGQ